MWPHFSRPSQPREAQAERTRPTGRFSPAPSPTLHASRPTIVGVRRRCRAPNWVRNSPPGRGSTCCEMLHFTLPAEVWRAWFSAHITISHVVTTIPLLTLVGRNFRLNCIRKQELRRYDPRSRFLKKTPFRPHLRAFYPHPANKSALRAEGASHFRAPGKRGWPPTSLRRGAWSVRRGAWSVAREAWGGRRDLPLFA